MNWRRLSQTRVLPVHTTLLLENTSETASANRQNATVETKAKQLTTLGKMVHRTA
jgi:hypothetical protein